MTLRKHTAPVSTIDVGFSSRMWTRALPAATRLCRRAANAALEAGRRNAGLSETKPVELAIQLTTDAAVRKLNAAYRNKNKPTNVLSFPAYTKGEPSPVPVMLGDVAYGVVAHEAKDQGKTLAAHVSHLVIHGVLHLLGYDHEQDDDAVKMERLETKILAGLGISDPYAAVPAPRKPRRKSGHAAP
jgi:probable rRNA maturation factor